MRPYLAAHVAPTFGTIAAADGTPLHYRLFVPPTPGPHPVYFTVYGGPGAQSMRADLGRRRSIQFLVQHGWAVFQLDNRGATHRGKAFEDVLYRAMGKTEVADQLAALDWVKHQPWAAADKVVVNGWSYGGYMTLKLLEAAPHAFAAGIAGRAGDAVGAVRHRLYRTLSRRARRRRLCAERRARRRGEDRRPAAADPRHGRRQCRVRELDRADERAAAREHAVRPDGLSRRDPRRRGDARRPRLADAAALHGADRARQDTEPWPSPPRKDAAPPSRQFSRLKLLWRFVKLYPGPSGDGADRAGRSRRRSTLAVPRGCKLVVDRGFHAGADPASIAPYFWTLLGDRRDPGRRDRRPLLLRQLDRRARRRRPAPDRPAPPAVARPRLLRGEPPVGDRQPPDQSDTAVIEQVVSTSASIALRNAVHRHRRHRLHGRPQPQADRADAARHPGGHPADHRPRPPRPRPVAVEPGPHRRRSARSSPRCSARSRSSRRSPRRRARRRASATRSRRRSPPPSAASASAR